MGHKLCRWARVLIRVSVHFSVTCLVQIVFEVDSSRHFERVVCDRPIVVFFSLSPALSVHHSTSCSLDVSVVRNFSPHRSKSISTPLRNEGTSYFSQLSVRVDPDYPDLEEARWIMSEDVNIEHLLDVFTSIDANSGDVWNACAYFMNHLYWHKKWLVVLGPKIERLADNHYLKPVCLFQLSQLFRSIGKHVERKRLLVHFEALERSGGGPPGWSSIEVYTRRTVCSASMRKGCYRRRRHWTFTNGTMIHWNKHDPDNSSVRRCWVIISSTPQEKLDYEQPVFSQTKADDFRSAGATASLVLHMMTRASRRKPSITSRGPSKSHPLSTGAMKIFGFIMTWQSYILAKKGSMTRTFMSNAPNHTRLMTNTTWVARWNFRPCFSITNVGYRYIGQRPLIGQISVVSSRKGTSRSHNM